MSKKSIPPAGLSLPGSRAHAKVYEKASDNAKKPDGTAKKRWELSMVELISLMITREDDCPQDYNY
jgi:hypothetical protein